MFSEEKDDGGGGDNWSYKSMLQANMMVILHQYYLAQISPVSRNVYSGA